VSNHTISASFTDVGPDLMVTTVSTTTGAYTEQQISVTCTVLNQGQANAGYFDVNIYLSTDPLITENDIFLDSRLVSFLIAGAQNTLTFTTQAPSALLGAGGTYHIGAIVDVMGAVKETDETNNAQAGYMITVTGPDLVMSALSGPVLGSTDATIKLNHTIATLGGGAHPQEGFSIGMYLSKDNVITTSDRLIGSRWMQSLAPESTDSGIKAARLPHHLAAGTYYLGAIADYENTVAESNETNNVVAGNQIDVVQIAAGDSHTMALKPNGTLWAWGRNMEGQLGYGDPITTPFSVSPVQIGPDNAWNAIALGGRHSVALKPDGTLWAWGRNGDGQLGLGDNTIVSQPTPTQIGTENQWIAVLAGYISTAALKADGSLWTWGDNYYGQLGDGTTEDKHAPVQIGTEDRWIAVEGGDYHTVAVRSDGTLWAWGANWMGALGDGTTEEKLAPVQVGTDNQWIAAEGGGYHTLALKADGTLWAWGYNNEGQLGDTTRTDKTRPVQIGEENQWIAVAAGDFHSVALKADGTLWAWGSNDDGLLVSATTTSAVYITSPVQIGADNRWIAIAAGEYHTVALRSDGTVWAWGKNIDGQLGDGTLVSKSSPTLTLIPPTANFVGTPTAGTEPLTVNFTDLSSGGPTAWQWNFGDGKTSTLQNPSHIYTAAGTYTVSLTASNAGGSDAMTKTGYITVQVCTNQPFKIGSVGYATLQAAYDAAADGAVIKGRGTQFTQSLTANHNPPIAVTVEGGYNCEFTANPGATYLKGSITTSAGTLTVKDFVLQQ
jgi:PKD repeat protein